MISWNLARHKYAAIAIGLLLIALAAGLATLGNRPSQREPRENSMSATEHSVLPLPTPMKESETALEEALAARRSQREYGPGALELGHLTQLLWAAQGVTDPQGYRTAPSAGALYPLETYVVVGKVSELDAGLYRYIPDQHALEPVMDGDLRADLATVGLNQDAIRDGAVDLVLAAVYERTTQRYGEKGKRYVHMEAGHAAQNVYLQAAALELGTVVIGAFDDSGVQELLGLPTDQEPLYILPVGPLP